jgi:hypothetical protein
MAFPVAMAGEADSSRQLLEKSLAIAREAGDPALIGEVLWGLGAVDLGTDVPLAAMRSQRCPCPRRRA